jgi:hypothetical protein
LRIIKDFKVDDDVVAGNLNTGLVTNLMNKNSDAMDVVTEDATNFGPRAKGKEDVMISCYKEML